MYKNQDVHDFKKNCRTDTQKPSQGEPKGPEIDPGGDPEGSNRSEMFLRALSGPTRSTMHTECVVDGTSGNSVSGAFCDMSTDPSDCAAMILEESYNAVIIRLA